MYRISSKCFFYLHVFVRNNFCHAVKTDQLLPQPSRQVVSKKKVHIFSQGSVLMRHLGTPSVFGLQKKTTTWNLRIRVKPKRKSPLPVVNFSCYLSFREVRVLLDLNSGKKTSWDSEEFWDPKRPNMLVKHGMVGSQVALINNPFYSRVLNTLVYIISFHVTMYCHQEHDDIILPAIFTSNPWWSNNPGKSCSQRLVASGQWKNPVPVGSNQRIGWPEADIKNVGHCQRVRWTQ